jgi:Spherulation-specific family 4
LSITQLQLGIPAYADPDVVPELWAGVLSSPTGSIVIVNPDSGSGRVRDPRYAALVLSARRAGLRVFGYVDTDYGKRPTDEVTEDVARYLSWYGVDGVFFDQVSSGLAELTHYRSLTDAVRSLRLCVALNCGVGEIHSGYGEIADILCVFEGTGEAYADATFPAWMSGPSRSARLWHLVYDVPDQQGMREALARAAARPCDVVFVTDGSGPNPWDGLPHYWASEVAIVSAERTRE